MYTPCPCFSCGNQIAYCKDFTSTIDGGIEIDFFGMYGSEYDLSEMIIWICDQCIEQKMEERIFMINEDVTREFKMEE